MLKTSCLPDLLASATATILDTKRSLLFCERTDMKLGHVWSEHSSGWWGDDLTSLLVWVCVYISPKMNQSLEVYVTVYSLREHSGLSKTSDDVCGITNTWPGAVPDWVFPEHSGSCWLFKTNLGVLQHVSVGPLLTLCTSLHFKTMTHM